MTPASVLREKGRIGKQRQMEADRDLPPCPRCGNRMRRGREMCGDCAAKARREALRATRTPEKPSDESSGTGRCLDAPAASEGLCGVQWGNLDHRHAPCGAAVAAYWRPVVDIVVWDNGIETQVECRCGECEVRNLPLSQRTQTLHPMAPPRIAARLSSKTHSRSPAA